VEDLSRAIAGEAAGALADLSRARALAPQPARDELTEAEAMVRGVAAGGTAEAPPQALPAAGKHAILSSQAGSDNTGSA
jgi:hypothetical protein